MGTGPEHSRRLYGEGSGAASALQESDFPGSHCSEGWQWEVHTLGKDDFLAVSPSEMETPSVHGKSALAVCGG